MARLYWRNAMASSQRPVGGHEPGHERDVVVAERDSPTGTLMVQATNFSPRPDGLRPHQPPHRGRTPAGTGTSRGPYFGACLESGAVESSRWLLAATYQGLGFKPERIPAYAETVGRFSFHAGP